MVEEENRESNAVDYESGFHYQWLCCHQEWPTHHQWRHSQNHQQRCGDANSDQTLGPTEWCMFWPDQDTGVV